MKLNPKKFGHLLFIFLLIFASPSWAARDGSGNMSIPYNDFVSGTTISSSQVDLNNADLVSEITNSIPRDGQAAPTANIPMGGYKFTGLPVGTVSTDSVNFGQVQAQAYLWAGTAGGTKNALTLTPSPAISAYAAGQTFRFKTGASQTDSTVTVAVSGLSTQAIQNSGSALSASLYMEANKWYEITYDGTNFQAKKMFLPDGVFAALSGAAFTGNLSTTGTLTGGANGGTNGSLKLFGSTSGDATIKTAAAAGTATIFQLPATNGSSTNLLQTDGAGVTSWVAKPASNLGVIVVQKFSASGTYTATANLLYAVIECTGAGGGGGGVNSTSTTAGGGGGGGAYSRVSASAATIGASQVVTIGAAGAAGANTGGTGGTGGTTSVGTLCTAVGGAGGVGSSTNNVPGAGGLGGSTGTGIVSAGGNGNGGAVALTTPFGGYGGASYFGSGGSTTAATAVNAAGGAGVAYGSGGSGAGGAGGANTGGAGAVGQVTVTEFCSQ